MAKKKNLNFTHHFSTGGVHFAECRFAEGHFAEGHFAEKEKK